MTKIEEALTEVTNISRLSNRIAKAFNMKPTSVRINWIYGNSIPQAKEAKVLRLIQKEIKEQKVKA